jgi:hypothetical protein
MNQNIKPTFYHHSSILALHTCNATGGQAEEDSYTTGCQSHAIFASALAATTAQRYQ